MYPGPCKFGEDQGLLFDSGTVSVEAFSNAESAEAGRWFVQGARFAAQTALVQAWSHKACVHGIQDG